ncbi:YciI family protein [Massilia sp. W12]|uniref:YciI family protein n=1 Tax=Massilia sp. W12 TaxID=3126507 RepID=UPI0030D2C638
MPKLPAILSCLTLALTSLGASAQSAPATPAAAAPANYDAALAKKAGANENGMRKFVLVILKTHKPLPAGAQRDEMFKGHFANMKRLAAEGKLALAGPLDGVEGRRGIFVLAVEDVEEARKLVATDPVIIQGEMTADFHRFFASAAVSLIPGLHEKIALKPF